VRGARFRLLAATVAVCGFLVAAPAASAVTPPKRCGTVTANGKRYQVRAHVVRCTFARRWSRRYLRAGSRPRGYSCQRYSGSRIKFICRRSGRSYYALR